MPASTYIVDVTKIMLDYDTNYNDLYPNWADKCYYYLDNYNWAGTGSMPKVTYKSPDGAWIIKYEPGAGEVLINDTPFSACTWDAKRALFYWQKQFIKQAILTYSENYNL